MEKSSKNIWWILVIIIIAALAFWWGSTHPFVNQATAPSSNEKIAAADTKKETIPTETAKPADDKKETSIDSTSTSENGEIVYTNNKYGFTLTFPKNWKNFRVTSKKAGDNGYDYLSFELPSARGGYGSIFAVSFHTLAEWKAMQAEGSPMPSRLAGKDNLVFGYSFAQDDTGFVGYPDPVPGLTYKGPIFEAEEMIIPSFRLK